jgi:hypothetical protein
MTGIAPPPACACCGAGLTTSGPLAIGYACDCTRDQWGWGLVRCLSCLKCAKHCQCPEGPATSWDEVRRRAAAGTLAHQRAREGRQ